MSGRVLVIEDEPNITEAISFILSRDGWDVACHADGATALEVIRETAPDLLILDVMLPGQSGYDILRELRAAPATRDLPVLVLTARSQQPDRDLAARLGASRFMSKPFANADIRAAAREMVQA